MAITTPSMPSKEQAWAVGQKVMVPLFVAVVCFFAGQECSKSSLEKKHEGQTRELIEEMATEHDTILRKKDTLFTTLEEQYASLEGELDGVKDEKGQLLSEKSVQSALIAELKGEVSRLRTVSADVHIGEGDVIIREVPVDVFPEDFHDLIRWPDGTPVASVDYEAGTLSSRSCELALRLRAALGDTDSSFILLTNSGCEDDSPAREIPITDVYLTQRVPEKLKILEVKLGLGVVAGVDINNVQPLFEGALYMEWLHAHENVTLLAPQIGFGTHLSGGVNVIGYNVGDPLPLVEDLWLHGGVGVGAPVDDLVSPGIHGWLTVGTRL